MKKGWGSRKKRRVRVVVQTSYKTKVFFVPYKKSDIAGNSPRVSRSKYYANN